MTRPLDGLASSDSSRSTWEDRLAGLMFFLAILFLVVLAGLIHRSPRLSPDDLETSLIHGALAGLWLIFLLEAAIRFQYRDRQRPVWKALASAGACCLLPPLRMGCSSQARPGHIWLPAIGWQKIDTHLRRALERFFSVPMMIFALLVLPLFILEFYWADQVRAEPALALSLDIGTSVIWLAFAIELIVMASIADRRVRYCLTHWIDMAIVLLPAVEMLPLFRLLRLGRVLRLEQLLRWGRVQRLQAVAMRAWRALLVLQVVHRLTGRSLEYQLKQLHELVQAKEEEVADLRLEMVELEARIVRKGHSCQTIPLALKEHGTHYEERKTMPLV